LANACYQVAQQPQSCTQQDLGDSASETGGVSDFI
jgi:hypothetical protein